MIRLKGDDLYTMEVSKEHLAVLHAGVADSLAEAIVQYQPRVLVLTKLNAEVIAEALRFYSIQCKIDALKMQSDRVDIILGPM